MFTAHAEAYGGGRCGGVERAGNGVQATAFIPDRAGSNVFDYPTYFRRS